ncbi:MAG: hypothetical protein GX130_08750 [Candidatus Hydrogenedens sp.]|nr:hypothetical protein [Candidatus Hydrogenedens sp.]
MGTIILGISAVLFLLMIVGLSTSTENRGERSYARESRSSSRSMPTPSLRVQAPQLWDDYSSNRIAAEQRYEGKTIAVSGSVSKVMGSGRSVTVFLTGRDALIGGGIIGCDLAASESSKAATLGDGDYIEIVGTCKGHSYFGFVEGVQITKGIISDGSSSTTSVSASAPSVISARDVVAAFRENEVAAGQRFLHQKFTVTGDVVKADRNMWGTIEVILSADDQFADVYCYFGKSDASAVAKLRQGERVSIRGTCTSFDTVFVGVGQLVFKNCTIL